MSIGIGEKRAFTKSLKGYFREFWNADYRPIYDERGYADIYIDRYFPDRVQELLDFPVRFAEFHFHQEDELAVTKDAIGRLLEHFAPRIEWIDFRNIASATYVTERTRDVLPADPRIFSRLPNLLVASFTRVNVTDDIIDALASNPKLERIDTEEGLISEISIASISRCASLGIFDATNCNAFPPELAAKIEVVAPHVESVCVK